MNWEALGAVGEMLGGVAVVLSLLYIVLQIRQIRTSLRLTAYTDGNLLHQNTLAYVSPELAKIMAKAEEDTKLERWEELLLYQNFTMQLLAYETSYRNIEAGALPESERQALVVSLGNLVNSKFFKGMWRFHRAQKGFDEDFLLLVDSCKNSDGKT